jgi:hypothetical protein
MIDASEEALLNNIEAVPLASRMRAGRHDEELFKTLWEKL